MKWQFIEIVLKSIFTQENSVITIRTAINASVPQQLFMTQVQVTCGSFY